MDLSHKLRITKLPDFSDRPSTVRKSLGRPNTFVLGSLNEKVQRASDDV
jgi:uncharacterized protein YcgL (UPF0745 family)